MTSDLAERLRKRQRALRARGLERTLRARQASTEMIDLAGNDYLGLSRDPAVVAAAVDAARTWGAGATASRLVTGTTALHEQLEVELARFLGVDASLVFSSGYLANLGVVTALADPGTLVVLDATPTPHWSTRRDCREASRCSCLTTMWLESSQSCATVYSLARWWSPSATLLSPSGAA